MSAISSRIIRHTVVTTRHLTPELKLRLITPKSPLWLAKEDQCPFKDPFWAFYWPGGQAAARYILDNKNKMKNRHIIDIGCGCGAGAIAAAKTSARRVLANDIDLNALAASKINAEINDVNIETSSKNVIGTKLEEFDTILIGDMFYDEEFAIYLFEWLRALAKEGKTILIGDPGRHGLTEKRRQYLTPIAKYKLPKETCIENNGYTDTTLWSIR